MVRKEIFLDTETTGLEHLIHGIWQIVLILVITRTKKRTGEVTTEVHKFARKMRPFKSQIIDEFALDMSPFDTEEEIRALPDPRKVYKELYAFLKTHINPYDKNDKAIPIGYNANFDLDMLRTFFSKNKDVYLGSFLKWSETIDVLAMARILKYLGYKPLQDVENLKLETVCEAMGVELKIAHDARYGILATRKLHTKFIKVFKGNRLYVK